MRMRHLALLLALGLLPATASSGDKDDGFVPMFNGKDLSGWVNANCAPETFYVKDGMVITTGKPTGFLRTPRQYENFIAEFDWMHIPPAPGAVGNSGFFVWADPISAVGTPYTRGIEVQVLVNLEYKDKKTGAITATSHGDLFSIWGATCVPDRPHPLGWARCLPSENHCKGENEWNHYRVEANDGVIKLTVNGKLVSGVSKCSPRKGYLALESEGSECRFKNLKIKELPSTNPRPEEIADVSKGFQNLYNGLDLRGWKATDEHKQHWKTRDWVLAYDGKGQAAHKDLWTEKEYGDFELVVDWRLPLKPKKKDGDQDNKVQGQAKGGSGILLRGTDKFQIAIGPGLSGWVRSELTPPIPPKAMADQLLGKWNRFHIRMKGSQVTVFLNNKQVVDKERLPDIAARGRIGLLGLDEQVEFGNLFIRELGRED
jgi:Domain of Unknown Function (DUF1080)